MPAERLEVHRNGCMAKPTCGHNAGFSLPYYPEGLISKETIVTEVKTSDHRTTMTEINLAFLAERCLNIEDRMILAQNARDRFRLRGELQALTNTIQLMGLRDALAKSHERHAYKAITSMPLSSNNHLRYSLLFRD